MTTHPHVRKAIDEVQLAGPEPTSGKDVIDHLFPLTEEAAKPLTLHYKCKTNMHGSFGASGKNNDQSFDQCFQHGSYQQSKPQLMEAAYRHGELSRLIQQVLDPASTEVSLQAYEAAGAAVRKLCTVSCAGARGQWCEWP